MRFAFLAVAGSLIVSGCGKEDAAGNTSAVDQTISASDFVTNDVTAIDAATGADANMAADVDIHVCANASDRGDGNRSGPAAVRRERPRDAAPVEENRGDNAADEPLEPATAPAETNAG